MVAEGDGAGSPLEWTGPSVGFRARRFTTIYQSSMVHYHSMISRLAWGVGRVRIEKVGIEGFRLLEELEIMLEAGVTVIVGRNNSGKTSLTDIFERFAGQHGPTFRLQDFSSGIRKRFFEAWEMRKKAAQAEAILEKLPKIAITLTFGYDKAKADIGPLSPFIIDLDDRCTQAIVRIEYAPTLATLNTLFDLPPATDGENVAHHFFRALRETLPRAYAMHVCAIDPTNPTNRREFDGTAAVGVLVQCNHVRAQRTLDHTGQGDAVVIGKTLSALYKTATTDTAAEADRILAASLKQAVQSIESDVQENFDKMLAGLLPALQAFGFPSLNDTEIRPETSLNVEALLSDHTKIVYTGADGVHLPEHYNGLGTRNLIYMLLQLESFHKEYRARAIRPSTHLIFIEEPEAHLHPQMQEVFIKQLTEAVKTLSKKYPGEELWPVQFVITSHSSHVANAADFDAIRYLLNDSSCAGITRRSKVKDFKKHSMFILPEDRKFLQQYMTLTKCDLYFADKVILVEGPTESILIPKLCELVDVDVSDKAKLARQYVTCIEAGGAYSHLFYPLLDFLELKTLIITDIDAVKRVTVPTKKGGTRNAWVKCIVSEGTRSSNESINRWFESATAPKGAGEESDVTPMIFNALAGMPDEKKVKGYRRIAYQISEKIGGTACARSFEDALVLANPGLFSLPGNDDEATEAWELANTFHKTDTALRFAIEEKTWEVPRYIREGLLWLSEPPHEAPPTDSDPVNVPEGIAT